MQNRNLDWRTAVRWGALVGFALSVLTACTVSMSGGLLGALASIGVAVTVFLLAGATQTGCVEDPARDPEPKADAGPDAYIGPCLSQIEPDQGVADRGVDADPDMYIGPCLSPPEPDRGVERDLSVGPCLTDLAVFDSAVDMEIGPCLDVPAPDQGLAPDAGPDAFLGPCLSPPPPDPEEGGAQLSPEALDRAAVFDKVAASLPADIAARLRSLNPKSRS